jgi:hypothetical protein
VTPRDAASSRTDAEARRGGFVEPGTSDGGVDARAGAGTGVDVPDGVAGAAAIAPPNGAGAGGTGARSGEALEGGTETAIADAATTAIRAMAAATRPW